MGQQCAQRLDATDEPDPTGGPSAGFPPDQQWDRTPGRFGLDRLRERV